MKGFFSFCIIIFLFRIRNVILSKMSVFVYTVNIMNQEILVLPKKFENILKRNQELYADVLGTVKEFAEVLKKNELYFFEEYTDHGIGHIENVLECACRIIDDKAMDELMPEDVAVLVLAVVLHDIGMHVGFSGFKRMLDGEYDGMRMKELDKKSWKELWEEFLVDCKYFSGYQREMIWGDPYYDAGEPDLRNAGKLTGNDRKLIGEFIRRYHPRIAHEIAMVGFWGNELVEFGRGCVDEDVKKIAGIVARSHGIAVRDTFGYLQKHYSGLEWKKPRGISVVFLMAVLRVADYLQMDKSRTSHVVLKLKMFGSPYSLKEHQAHLAVKRVNFECEDPECILVNCKPEDSQMYVKLKRLIDDIQYELDVSWAVLGEVYGGKNKLGLKYRRICSDITEEVQMERLKYVPQKISFRFNDELSKLLIAPLYGNHPTFGVRELVQNATDACLERDKQEELAGNKGYDPRVKVSVDRNEEGIPVFSIVDNGKGMTIKEIVDYFLTIGSSFRASKEWKKLSGEHRVYRNGRFGIGVLAAFLIGDRISVRTRSVKDECGYCFSAGLDDEFIEVKKDETIREAGTEIWIESSEERIERLEESRGLDLIKWYEWYINKRPKMEYFKFGKLLCGEQFFKQKILRKLKHSCDEFGDVYWSPVNILDISSDSFLACNGIVISKDVMKSQFVLDNDADKTFSIIRLPDLHVSDLYNNIPLRLDREDIDNRDYKYPFENELYIEVVKDFIAQFLYLDHEDIFKFNEEIYITKNNYYKEEGLYIMSCKEGYTLNCNYFVRKLRAEYDRLFVIAIEEMDAWNHAGLLDEIMDNRILYIPRYQDIRYGELDGIFLENKPEIKFIFSNMKGMPDYNIDEVIAEDGNWPYGFQCRRLGHKGRRCLISYGMYNKSIEKEIRILGKEFEDKLFQAGYETAFTIVEYDWVTYKVGDVDKVWNDLFKRYFGENAIVPYDLEERKRRFPLAFEELKDYIKDYTKK